MNNFYPHLQILIDALTVGLKLDVPIQAYANIEQVTIQGTPAVILIPENALVIEAVSVEVRKITALHILQEWLILTILRDASDQKVTASLLNQLGEWQTNIINILCKKVLMSGGPIKILEMPKADSIEGGAIAGKIRISTQFVFNSE